MPQVLTTNATITCPHGGLGQSIPSDPKWLVSNGVVLLENDTGVISACAFVSLPCVSYTLKSMGLNATKVGDSKVVLSTDFQQTNTGLPLVIVETNECFDNTPPGGGAGGGGGGGGGGAGTGGATPPSPEALADFSSPQVHAVTPTLIYVLATMAPAPVVLSFSLSAQHPLKWILTMLNLAAQQSLDVTNGQPDRGLAVTPVGGDWSSPSLTVTATLSAAFVASLGPGAVYFYLTGISQRGLSANDLALLTVS